MQNFKHHYSAECYLIWCGIILKRSTYPHVYLIPTRLRGNVCATKIVEHCIDFNSSFVNQEVGH